MTVLYAYPGNEAMAASLARQLPQARVGECDWHRFPDGETRVRIDTSPDNEDAILVCTLDHPDPKLAPIIFAADTLRDLGARRVGLVAPYLAYMRQDARFNPGEAISSRPFAAVISRWFDWLVTIDPHLHRYASLDAVYSIPTSIVHAAEGIAAWLATEYRGAVVVGPDQESEQWVSDVAKRAGLPFAVLVKERLGDRNVRVSLPEEDGWREHIPVLVDDIISSGRTMASAARALSGAGRPAPVCVAVHGLFSEDARSIMHAAGIVRIATTNSIPGPLGVIDMTPALANAISAQLHEDPSS